MSDTPLTDGAQFLAQFYEDHELVEGFVVTAETAQRMERDRAVLLFYVRDKLAFDGAENVSSITDKELLTACYEVFADYEADQ